MPLYFALGYGLGLGLGLFSYPWIFKWNLYKVAHQLGPYVPWVVVLLCGGTFYGGVGV